MGWTLVSLRWTLARATPPVQLLPNAVRLPLGLSVKCTLLSAMRRRNDIRVTFSGTMSVGRPAASRSAIIWHLTLARKIQVGGVSIHLCKRDVRILRRKRTGCPNLFPSVRCRGGREFQCQCPKHTPQPRRGQRLDEERPRMKDVHEAC